MNAPTPLRIFIGYDPREDEAYRVCAYSMRRRSSIPLEIHPLGQPPGLYTRTWHRTPGGQRIDDVDGKPFSTDFAFSRFLVPALADPNGWALFCDCDFLFQADVAELLTLADPRFAVQCVQHDHRPSEPVKMDGQAQTRYFRKNWSSLVLWNCAHPGNAGLTVADVSTRPGAWLHGFRWLADAEIGALPESWNWLDGWSSPEMPARAVHFTRGGPWLSDHVPGPYAEAWLREREAMELAAPRAADAEGVRPAPTALGDQLPPYQD